MTKHTITYDEVFGSGEITETFASASRAGIGCKRLYGVANFHSLLNTMARSYTRVNLRKMQSQNTTRWADQ